MAKLFTIPQRIRAVSEVVAAVKSASGVDIGPVKKTKALGGWHIGTSGTVLQTPRGPVDFSVWCSDGLLHVYCQYQGEMDDAKRERARQLGGNPYSGKLNWWCAPDRRIADHGRFMLYAGEAAKCYEQFLRRILAE